MFTGTFKTGAGDTLQGTIFRGCI